MKLFTAVALSLCVIYGTPAFAQDEDCWHYEDGDAVFVGSVGPYAHDVAVSGQYAYVTFLNGLSVFDVSDPANPQIVAVVDGQAIQVEVDGNFAYVAGGGLKVVDITNPTSPLIVADVDVGVLVAIGVAVSGDRAYVVGIRDEGGTLDLSVVDISDPQDPQIVGIVESVGYVGYTGGGTSLGVAVSGDYAYVASFLVGLRVININPDHPEGFQIVGSAGSEANDVAVSGNYAYLTTMMGTEGLLVCDVSDPHDPQIVGSAGNDSRGGGVAVSNSYAYVAGFLGLCVVDIVNPESPQILGFSNMPGELGIKLNAALGESFVYVTADYGFAIHMQQCEVPVAIEGGPEETSPDEEVPSAALRLAVHPNPFNPQTTITFSLERDEWARVEVHDLNGIRVAVLADRTFTAGEHSVLWNGRDVAGRSMPSGTYLVRLETESAVRAQKLMLVR